MSTPLLRRGRQADSFFDLLGHGEIDATAAVGFVCSRSPAFAAAMIELVTGTAGATEAVRLEQRTTAAKRTDIELDSGRAVVVIEAKVGFDIPTSDQLGGYREPLIRDSRPGYLATLTNAPTLARRRIGEVLEGFPLMHLSWEQVRETALRVSVSRAVERFLLRELTAY
jgi:hypothetical protein